MMVLKKFFGLFCFLFLISLVSAATSEFTGGYGTSFTGDGFSSSWQSYQPSFNQLYSASGTGVLADLTDIWPILRNIQNDQCEATSDFIIGIPSGGCTPSVVRSDLLEDQSVPVFCQLYAIKVNPLIKVSSIKSITFQNKPEGVRSIVFHPARAAVKSYTTLLGDPTINNIGYVVIILNQNRVEDNMEEWIAGNLTATIRYEAEEAYGTSAGDYYLPVMSDADWQKDYASSSFWLGRGYLRVQSVDEGTAKIQVLTSKDKIVNTFTLKEGQTSSTTYLPGFYCRAGLKIKLNSVVSPEDKALLNIDGQQLWVREGTRFLDGKCRVTKLDVSDNNDGKVTIRCTGSSNIDLELLKPGNFSELSVKDYRNRQYIYYSDERTDYYLNNSGIYTSRSVRIATFDGEKVVVDSARQGELIGSVNIDKIDSYRNGKFSGKAIEIPEKDYGTSNVETYFGLSNKTVGELIDEYGLEEKENGDYYGEEALYEEIVLAGQLGKYKTQSDLINAFVGMYPSSDIIEQVRQEQRRLNDIDYSHSYIDIYVNDKFHSISVVDLKSVDEGEKTVDLKINNLDRNNLNEGWESEIGSVGNLSIVEILPGKIKVSFDSATRGVSTVKRTINEGESETFEGVDVSVRNIAIKEVAHVSIVPEIEHTTTKADFTFRIGIEKRAIELSPDRAKSMLKNLNESIERWEQIVDRLGTVVTGLKGACFATSAVLMIKNMATGISGEALARQKVMAKYKALCETEHGSISRTQCYNDYYSDAIEKDVEAMTKALNGVNDKLELAQKGNVQDTGGLFGGEGITDQSKYIEDLRKQVSSEKISVRLGNEDVEVPVSSLNSVSQLKAVLLSQELSGQGVAGDVAKAEMDSALRNIALTERQKKESDSAAADLKNILGTTKLPKVQSFVSADVRLLQWDGETSKGYTLNGINFDKERNIQFFNYNGQKRLFVLSDSGSGNMGVEEEYILLDGSWVKADSKDRVGSKFTFSREGSPGECSYSWPSGKATVSYYESGDNAGLPAIVPFDLKNGWYVMVPNSGGTFLDDSTQGYTASADVRYFKICNIGPNRLMESGTGDDLCQSFDSNTIGVVKDFIPCKDLSSSQVREIYNNAREAIRQASSQKGQKSIRILDQELELGNPMSEVGGFECQDFMSPEDCKLMFNVCDPVICPPSRCDLGGKMPVSNVIQTGIIGSLVLCLPNAAEGVLFPICLSGVQAGLDSYVSILKSEQECLQRSLETGEHVGICDEITSIYMCEFFWKQLSPVIPNIVAGLFSSGNVRGGGEYALVQQSWNVMQKSIDYFKGVYAQNAFRAFEIRNAEEAGSTVCSTFIGTSVPGSANILDSLLEPESPSQFYAQFSESLFTEATVPSTSQYKVYYHIYAGNDVGAQYRIYLKNPPETTYYRANPSIWVKSGYIGKGDSADESVEFTAPSGYKELCVVINAREECGFKQVTSDFGLNYVQDKYVQEQAETTDITTEEECISGTPSVLSALNLNLQSGVEDTINPEIAMSGIVRVCASANPSAGVDSSGYVECTTDDDCGSGYSCPDSTYCQYENPSNGNVSYQKSNERWKDVGYCGDAALRCWLDTQSVTDSLESISIIENTSVSLLEEQSGLIDTGVLNLEGVQKTLSSVRTQINDLRSSDLVDLSSEGKVVSIVNELNKIIGTEDFPGAGTNVDRAEALALKASVYRLVVEEARKTTAVQTERVANDVWGDGVIGEACGSNQDCTSGVCDDEGVCVESLAESAETTGNVEVISSESSGVVGKFDSALVGIVFYEDSQGLESEIFMVNFSSSSGEASINFDDGDFSSDETYSLESLVEFMLDGYGNLYDRSSLLEGVTLVKSALVYSVNGQTVYQTEIDTGNKFYLKKDGYLYNDLKNNFLNAMSGSIISLELKKSGWSVDGNRLYYGGRDTGYFFDVRSDRILIVQSGVMDIPIVGGINLDSGAIDIYSSAEQNVVGEVTLRDLENYFYVDGELRGGGIAEDIGSGVIEDTNIVVQTLTNSIEIVYGDCTSDEEISSFVQAWLDDENFVVEDFNAQDTESFFSEIDIVYEICPTETQIENLLKSWLEDSVVADSVEEASFEEETNTLVGGSSTIKNNGDVWASETTYFLLKGSGLGNFLFAKHYLSSTGESSWTFRSIEEGSFSDWKSSFLDGFHGTVSFTGKTLKEGLDYFNLNFPYRYSTQEEIDNLIDEYSSGGKIYRLDFYTGRNDVFYILWDFYNKDVLVRRNIGKFIGSNDYDWMFADELSEEDYLEIRNAVDDEYNGGLEVLLKAKDFGAYSTQVGVLRRSNSNSVEVSCYIFDDSGNLVDVNC